MTSNHFQRPGEACAELCKVRSTFPVLGVLGEVQHVVVNAGEEGQESFTVHREGWAHQLVSNFVSSLGFV